VINPTLYDKTRMNSKKDFDGHASRRHHLGADGPSIRPSANGRGTALIKAHPSKYSYTRLGRERRRPVGEQFRLSLGLDLVHVPFNSAGLAVVRGGGPYARFASHRHTGCATGR
jgi:hypothetical protein